MAELHYIQFSEQPFLYSPVSSALLRLGDGHLPFSAASDLTLSKKTPPFISGEGLLTLIPHFNRCFVTFVNTWHHSALQGASASSIGYLLLVLLCLMCSSAVKRKRHFPLHRDQPLWVTCRRHLGKQKKVAVTLMKQTTADLHKTASQQWRIWEHDAEQQILLKKMAVFSCHRVWGFKIKACR